MNSLKTLALAASLVLAAAAPAAWAQSHGAHGAHGDRGGMAGQRWMAALDDVDATDAQRQQIRDIFKAAKTELQPLRAQGMALHQQQRKLWAAPNIDAAAMEALRKQQSALREQVGSRMQRAMVDAGRVLSPEQRAKLQERAAKRAQRMQERMQERMKGQHRGA
jgi:periplasmic protein CpxP/Spy